MKIRAVQQFGKYKRLIPLSGAIFLAAWFIFILQSCSKKDFDFSKMTSPKWDPVWSLPLIHSELTIQDLLKKGTAVFIEDPVTHLITIEYSDRLFTQSAEEYLQIPDQTNIAIASSSLVIVVPPGDSTISELTLPYSFLPAQAGQRFDSLFIKSGNLSLDFISRINHSAKVTLSIPNAVKNGKPFSTTASLTYSGTLPVQATLDLDFSGYKILPDNSPGHENEISFSARIVVYGDNNPNLSPYSFSAVCDLTAIKFSKAFGYLGQYEYPLTDTLFLNIFKNSFQGNITLQEIDLYLTTSNSTGMPLELEVRDLVAYSPKKPPYTVDIADPASGFPNPLTIPSPDIYHIGTTKDTTFQFGENNSYIIPAINLAPEYIYFNILGKSNPANNAAYENFVLDTSRFAVDMKLSLPLFGSISGFYIEDTINFNFDIPQQAKSLAFKVRTENHYPLNAEIQVYFADKDYQIIDSLFSGDDHRILVAAPVGGPPDYRVIENPPVQPLIFTPDPFPADDLDRLRQTKFLMIRAKMSTYNSNLVKIYSGYLLDVRVAADIQLDSQN